MRAGKFWLVTDVDLVTVRNASVTYTGGSGDRTLPDDHSNSMLAVTGCGKCVFLPAYLLDPGGDFASEAAPRHRRQARAAPQVCIGCWVSGQGRGGGEGDCRRGCLLRFRHGQDKKKVQLNLFSLFYRTPPSATVTVATVLKPLFRSTLTWSEV